MSTRTLKLEIITPDKVVLSEDGVVSVVAPGTEGYLGVMANHAPLMTELAVGELDYRRADGFFDEIAIAGGFMEVSENKVTVLADIAEPREEIDLDRAVESKQRAEERLASAASEVDLERARIALLKAINRMRVAGKQH
jgi:F-type H+-transporting ATPase subunit epsilon